MKKEVKFYLFGDSICFGQLVSPHHTWVSRLAIELEDMANNIDFIVQNASINGNITRQALERMPYDITSHHPEILLIQFGMNDCNYWETDFGVPRVSPKAFKANLEEMVERAMKCGTHRIFLCTNHPSMKGAFVHLSEMAHSQSNHQYNELIREVAASLIRDKYPLTLIDNESAWLEHLQYNKDILLSNLLLADGVHLNQKGHNLYIKYVVPTILSIIKRYF